MGLSWGSLIETALDQLREARKPQAEGCWENRTSFTLTIPNCPGSSLIIPNSLGGFGNLGGGGGGEKNIWEMWLSDLCGGFSSSVP